MDYPQLNFLFGLALIFSLVVSTSLCVLLAKVQLPIRLSRVSWAAVTINLFSTVYIGILFLRFMTPSFNRQLALALFLIGGLGAAITAGFYRKEISERIAVFLFAMQMLMSLANIVIALVLYRSLVPI